MPSAISTSSPSLPCEENEVESGGEGGRGANPEVDFAAGNVHVVVALLALRKRMRSGSGGEGGRGANVEAEVVAVGNNRVIAIEALRGMLRCARSRLAQVQRALDTRSDRSAIHIRHLDAVVGVRQRKTCIIWKLALEADAVV